MGLKEELDAFRAEFVRKTPPGRAELYDAKVDELRRQFPIGAALNAEIRRRTSPCPMRSAARSRW